MAFLTEKEELKAGLILFRRGDVGHRMWYCRMKMPKADRYKKVQTFSLILYCIRSLPATIFITVQLPHGLLALGRRNGKKLTSAWSKSAIVFGETLSFPQRQGKNAQLARRKGYWRTVVLKACIDCIGE